MSVFDVWTLPVTMGKDTAKASAKERAGKGQHKGKGRGKGQPKGKGPVEEPKGKGPVEEPKGKGKETLPLGLGADNYGSLAGKGPDDPDARKYRGSRNLSMRSQDFL